MSAFKWLQFTGEVILWAVRWYCRCGISYREFAEMLAERGVEVDHTTLYRWTQRYAPELEHLHRRMPRDFTVHIERWMVALIG
jgi:transposase-like protein